RPGARGLRARPLRRRRRVPPRGCSRVRTAVGPVRRDRGPPPGRPGMREPSGRGPGIPDRREATHGGEDGEDSSAPESQTLWHGRFGAGPAEELLAFTSSLAFDQRLAADDLDGSRAHVRMLGRVKLISEDESQAILAALDTVESELAADSFVFAPTDEDIHTAIERRVIELAGEAGAKLHTGRSRNDQVVTALRLYVRREGAALGAAIVGL